MMLRHCLEFAYGYHRRWPSDTSHISLKDTLKSSILAKSNIEQSVWNTPFHCKIEAVFSLQKVCNLPQTLRASFTSDLTKLHSIIIAYNG